MPIYEYACNNCEHTLDALQKISESPLTDCPECGQPELKRLISAPRFRLKGAGWYETDFKKDGQRNVLKGDSEPDKSTGSDAKDKVEKKESGEKKDSSPPAAKANGSAGKAET